LSQPGTTDYFLNVILCDFICSLITVAWPPKHVGVRLIQIYNCKQCAYLLVYLNKVHKIQQRVKKSTSGSSELQHIFNATHWMRAYFEPNTILV
jgi:hypothetical protein